MQLRAEAVRSFLAALLHVAWTLAFASAFETTALTLCGHVSRCLAMSSHLMTGPSGNSSFCFPRISMFPSAVPRGNFEILGTSH